METNVINHDTKLWKELKDLYENEQHHSQKARELWPEIASHMAELRGRYKANQEFGLALMEHGIEYDKDTRAAFVWMGQLDPDALIDALDLCKSRSPRMFKEKVESWEDDYFKPLSQSAKTTSHSTSKTGAAENMPETPEETQIEESQTEEKKESKTVKVPATAAMHGYPRADELYALSALQNLPNQLTKLGKGKGWNLVMECFDLGLLSPEGADTGGNQKMTGRCVFNLKGVPRTFMINVLSRYEIDKPGQRKKFEEEVMPFLREHANELIENPEQSMELWERDRKARSEALAKAREEEQKRIEEEKRKRELEKAKALGQGELVICGMQIWPSLTPNVRTFDYEDLRNAFMIFEDLEMVATVTKPNGTENPSRRSRAINMRHTVNTLKSAGLKREICSALTKLAYALESGDGEKVVTTFPYNWNTIKGV